MVSVDERLTYKPHPEDPEKYVFVFSIVLFVKSLNCQVGNV